MPRVVDVQESKTQLSRLLAEVDGGQEITIVRAGHPVARLVPVTPRRRLLGTERGRIRISDDFDDPMPDGWFDS